MAEQEFVVPIDEPIQDFLGHLDANPRTILSSRFGDGKSYFLNGLRNSEDAKAKYEFLTLYPVNYQVADNKDIFELIKADILFQLFLHNMLSEMEDVPHDVALSFFVQENKLSLATKLVGYISEVALSSEEAKALLCAMKGAKLFKDLSEKFVRFRDKYNDDTCLEKFMKQIDKNFLYESDIVSYLIKRAIKDYKGRTKKQVVLIIEDLDRIDPAHLFRILNVFSAHMDASYRYGVKAGGSLLGNKFDLDKVVVVLDYNNMKHIFHHFYGEDTDFNGYISKFTSSIPFYYSLAETRRRYIKQEILRQTGAPEQLIDWLIPMDRFEEKTIRDVVHAFDIGKQLKKVPLYNHAQGSVKLNDVLLKVMALMRRLKLPEEDIQQSCLILYQNDQDAFFTYAGPYAFLMDSCHPSGLSANLILEGKDRRIYQILIGLDEKTGLAKRGNMYIGDFNNKTNLLDLGKLMLDFVRK